MKGSILDRSGLVALFLVVACSDAETGANAGSTAATATGGSSSDVTGGAAPITGGASSVAGGSPAVASGGVAPTTGGASSVAGGSPPATGGAASAGGTSPAGGTPPTTPTTGGSGPGGGGTDPGTGATDPGTGGSDPAIPPEPGHITLHDPVPGWASVEGGTTGGGTDLASAVTVSSMADLQSQASGAEPKIILVEPGTYNGDLEPGSNKTIIGTAPGATVHGSIIISGEDKTNVIVRNIAVRQDECGSYSDCQSGTDAVYIGRGAHHVWLDHMDIADGQDGNCDITKAADYVTVSWTKFHYTYAKAHAFSNLIAGNGGETESRGKLQITYMNCWWGDNVDQRQPMGRFGKIHMLNNYHKNDPTYVHEVNRELSLIAEHCYYDIPGKSIFRGNKGPTGYKGIGNEGTADGLNDSMGTVFEIPYSYTPMSATEARDAVTSSVCGAGNTCELTR